MGCVSTGRRHCDPTGRVCEYIDFRPPLSLILFCRATTQLILLPGNDYTSAGEFISNGSADALSKVTNPDGGFDNLVFDVHKYLDSDNSYAPVSLAFLYLSTS